MHHINWILLLRVIILNMIETFFRKILKIGKQFFYKFSINAEIKNNIKTIL